MSKNTRKKKISKAKKMSNNKEPDEKKIKLHDIQQIVETSENSKFLDFVKLNLNKVTNQIGKKALEKLDKVANKGKLSLFNILATIYFSLVQLKLKFTNFFK